MTLTDHLYSVWLQDRQVGTIHQRGDYTRFTLAEHYRTDPERAVLGLIFEQDLIKPHSALLRLPPWFSNLLPEGAFREWIADARNVSPHREMELLAQVGHDLPGAVRVLPAEEPPDAAGWERGPHKHEAEISIGPRDQSPRWRFSLAGVGLKFSMLAKGDRLTLPASGEGGDWIVKFPDRRYQEVPRNEYTMMSLAGAIGIEVPKIRLVHRDELDGVPNRVWPNTEEWAYAVRRFDRDDNRRLVHIEDLAQVRNFYPDGNPDKYAGNYETVAALIYRRSDVVALREFARRLAFCVLVANGDAHLKNWSLIYRDPRIPTLSPAYDLAATAPYMEPRDGPEELALKFGGSKRFETVTLGTFARLQRRLNAPDADLADHVADLVKQVRAHWPRYADQLSCAPTVRDSVTASIDARVRSLTGGAR